MGTIAHLPVESISHFFPLTRLKFFIVLKTTQAFHGTTEY